MLIFDKTWRYDIRRASASQHLRQLDGVRGANLQMSIPIQFDEFAGGTQNLCAVDGFLDPPIGRAMGARLAARTDDEVSRHSTANSFGDHAATGELDVVGVRAKRDKSRRITNSARHMLPRPA